MAQGAPQDIANDILDQLHALEEERSPAEFSIKRLEREIEKLKKINQSKYYFFRGALFALQWKVSEAVKNLITSNNIEYDQYNFINTGITFHSLGFYEEAFDMYKKALDVSNEMSSYYFNNFAKCAFLLGRYDEIAPYVASRMLVCNEEELELLKHMDGKYKKVFEIVDRKVLSEFASFMIKSAAINKKRASEILIDFVQEGDTKVFIRFAVQHSDAETVQSLNDTLIELICESSDFDISSLTVNGCFLHRNNFQKL